MPNGTKTDQTSGFASGSTEKLPDRTEAGQRLEQNRNIERHDYLIVNGKGRLYAYGEAVCQCPEPMQELFRELLLKRYNRGTIPAIVCRQEAVPKGLLRVGWPSWRISDGVRFRTALCVPEKTIEQCITPYEVFRREENWPEIVRKELTETAVLSQKYRIKTGLIGAVGMETLTGMPYIREASDLDLVIQLEKESDLPSFYQEIKTLSGRKLDIELQIPGIGGIKLDEWMSNSQSVLVKSLDSVKFRNKKELTLGF